MHITGKKKYLIHNIKHEFGETTYVYFSSFSLGKTLQIIFNVKEISA